jgi:outer membrane lipoprotein LolB
MSRVDRRRTLWRLLSLPAAAVLLTACAAPALRTPGAEGRVWTGRLALTVHSEPPQSYSAGFELSGSPTSGELQLTSPLGNVLALARWSPTGAELRQGDQVTRRATLDQLAADLGNAPLPVAALFGWLQGQPQEGSDWTVDLSRQPEGRIVARRLQPLPTAELRLVFQP